MAANMNSSLFSVSEEEAIQTRYIKQMIIKGFKKFVELTIDFNPQMNILVGENEAGKSTIIDAIRLVLSQPYRNTDKSFLFDLFNQEQVRKFEANPTVENLPFIHIEILLALVDKGKDSQLFWGETHCSEFGKGASYGIRFDCSFDKEEGAGLDDEISAGHIPVEYYRLEWKTFAERPYYLVHPPLRFLAVDTAVNESSSPFSRYARDLFLSRVIEKKRLRHRHDFRTRMKELVENLDLPDLSETQKFGVNDKRILLENVLSILDGEIALENKGSGTESIVKMELAFSKKEDADVITIEEPETHLSYSNLRKLLKEIQGRNTKSQMIIATHSNMIASRLDVRNVQWISEDKPIVKSLKDINEETAEFFAKVDHSNLLDLLLAEKVILVEGPTEFLLIPKFYKDIYNGTGRTVESDNITVLSCNGISFSHYLRIAETRQKRVAVLTDNDGIAERIKLAKEYNLSHCFTHVFMPDSIEHWTWEKCLFDINEEYFKTTLKIRAGAKYLYHGKDVGAHLGYMLNNKANEALRILQQNPTLTVPEYVKEAIQWLDE